MERAPRSTWSASDAASVAVNEGRPVVTEGYLLFVRHEGTESPNRHDSNERDYHAWLATAPGTLADRSHSKIVELTPRVVARNAGWGNQTAILALRGKHVRISGWLLLDQEHPEQLQKTRGTLWEIHPVMKIAVEQGGKPDVAPAPGTASTPTTSKTTPTPSKAGLQVRVTVRPNPTSDGTPTTVQATTSPGAQCTVRVVYASGSASGSASLKTTQTAGSYGGVSWTWKPETRRPGPATATVHCTIGSQSADGSAQFTVQG